MRTSYHDNCSRKFAVAPTMESLPTSINTVQFSNDGKTIMSGGQDRKLILWNSTTGAMEKRT